MVQRNAGMAGQPVCLLGRSDRKSGGAASQWKGSASQNGTQSIYKNIPCATAIFFFRYFIFRSSVIRYFVFSMFCFRYFAPSIICVRNFATRYSAIDILSGDILRGRYFAIQYYAIRYFALSISCTSDILLLDILQLRHFAILIFCVSDILRFDILLFDVLSGTRVAP